MRSRVTPVVIGRGTLHASRHTLEWIRESGTVVIPCGMATVILVEPGVSISDAAVKMCADHGMLLIWAGEAGVRVYSAGLPGGASGERILPASAGVEGLRSRVSVKVFGFPPRVRGLKFNGVALKPDTTVFPACVRG